MTVDRLGEALALLLPPWVKAGQGGEEQAGPSCSPLYPPHLPHLAQVSGDTVSAHEELGAVRDKPLLAVVPLKDAGADLAGGRRGSGV